MNALLVSLFEHKAWCNTQLAEALRCVQGKVDGLSWVTIMLTFEHTAIVDRIFRARLEGRESEVTSVVADSMPDLETLTKTMAETDAWYIGYASRATPVELEQMVEFTFVSDGMAGRMSKGDMLGHIITHGASHRGGIGKMLEALQQKGAPDMMTTFRHPTG